MRFNLGKHTAHVRDFLVFQSGSDVMSTSCFRSAVVIDDAGTSGNDGLAPDCDGHQTPSVGRRTRLFHNSIVLMGLQIPQIPPGKKGKKYIKNIKSDLSATNQVSS